MKVSENPAAAGFFYGLDLVNKGQAQGAYAFRKDAKDAIHGRLSAGDYAPHP